MVCQLGRRLPCPGGLGKAIFVPGQECGLFEVGVSFFPVSVNPLFIIVAAREIFASLIAAYESVVLSRLLEQVRDQAGLLSAVLVVVIAAIGCCIKGVIVFNGLADGEQLWRADGSQ